MPENTGAWYYRIGEQVVGPLEYAEIRRRAESRNLVATDLVSTDGQEWTLAGQMPGLADAYAGGAASLEAAALQYHGRTVSLTLSSQSTTLLRETAPWIMIFAIIVLVVAGLMFVGLLFVILAGVASGQAVFLVQALFILIAALLYTATGNYLLRYSRLLRKALDTGAPGAMEGAFEAQKAFWRLVTILLIVGVSLYLLVIVAAVVLGLMAPGLRHI